MKRKATTRRRSPLAGVLGALASIVVLVGGTVTTLQAMGVIDVTRLWQQSPYSGLVAIPASGSHIPAYAKVRRDHLVDHDTGQAVKWFYMPPEKVRPEWIIDKNDILGRVMCRDKEPGYVFTESDFLPLGSRPGVSGGVPAGKRAMVLDAAQIRGLKDLQIGDRFDLLASTPVDLKSLQPRVRSLLVSAGGQAALPGATSGVGGQASVRVLAHNGLVITSTPTDAPRPGEKPSTEMTIAIDPDEINPITEALAMKAGLYCVVRSGRPDENAADPPTPASDPLAGMSVIETVRGRKVDLEAFLPQDGEKDGGETRTATQGRVAALP
jgi:hypothetical protein